MCNNLEMNTLVKEIIAEAERMADIAVLCKMVECLAVESGDEAGFFKQLQQAVKDKVEYYRYPSGRVSVWDDNHEEKMEYYKNFLLEIRVLSMKRQQANKKEESLDTEQGNKDEGQQDNKDEEKEERKLREVFFSERAKWYFAKAEEAGLVNVLDGGKRLEWKGKTKALLAYFIDRCSIFLRMRIDAGRYEVQDPIPWKDFLALFGEDDTVKATLVQAAKKYRKGEKKRPNGYKKVNALEQYN